MTGGRARGGLLAAVAVVVLVASACTGGGDGASGDVPASPAASGDQPDAGRAVLERAVLDALAADPHPKDVRWEPDRERVVVTVRTSGAALDPEVLSDLRERAEGVTDGVEVVVETTDEDVPTED
jgi:hypothetical protein